jgi:hypothetical protein
MPILNQKKMTFILPSIDTKIEEYIFASSIERHQMLVVSHPHSHGVRRS